MINDVMMSMIAEGRNYLSDFQVTGGLERVEEVLRDGVLVGEVLEELLDARLEVPGAHEVLHHPDDGAALAVGDGVEHRVDLVRRVHVHHDGPARDGGV